MHPVVETTYPRNMSTIRRIREEKKLCTVGVFGRFFSPHNHNIVRQTFETEGWILTRKNNNSYRVVNDPLGIFVGLVEGQQSTQSVVVGSSQWRAATGTQ